MARRAGIPIATGTLLLIGAVAGFVIVPEHKPDPGNGYVLGPGSTPTGWSSTGYDLARIATWALLILGVLLVAVGLINHARR